MFKKLKDRLSRYYSAVVLPDKLFDGERKFTLQDKQDFVDHILSKNSSRKILEKYIEWKYGIKVKAAMRSKEDAETRDFKNQGQGIAECTYDFSRMWEEVKRAEDDKLEKQAKASVKSEFRFFGNGSQD